MLTIGKLAEYVGVTRRAIRHYHSLGLLPEPARDSSGYRSYGAQAVVDLRRIKVLTEAGVPLAQVRELVDAGPDAFRSAVAGIDATLDRRIAGLERTREALAGLAVAGQPFLPPAVSVLHEQMRQLGVSERTLSVERDGWVLVQVLFPELVDGWLALQADLLADAGYRLLFLRTDEAMSWAADDPRIEQLARDTLEWMLTRGPMLDSTGWDEDQTAYRLVTDFRREVSPGWRRLMERIEQLAHG